MKSVTSNLFNHLKVARVTSQLRDNAPRATLLEAFHVRFLWICDAPVLHIILCNLKWKKIVNFFLQFRRTFEQKRIKKPQNKSSSNHLELNSTNLIYFKFSNKIIAIKELTSEHSSPVIYLAHERAIDETKKLISYSMKLWKLIVIIIKTLLVHFILLVKKLHYWSFSKLIQFNSI